MPFNVDDIARKVLVIKHFRVFYFSLCTFHKSFFAKKRVHVIRRIYQTEKTYSEILDAQYVPEYRLFVFWGGFNEKLGMWKLALWYKKILLINNLNESISWLRNLGLINIWVISVCF